MQTQYASTQTNHSPLWTDLLEMSISLLDLWCSFFSFMTFLLTPSCGIWPPAKGFLLWLITARRSQRRLVFKKAVRPMDAMKLAVELWVLPATLTQIRNRLPDLRDSPNASSQRRSLASPHLMWTWRLTVRWPVKQVVLSNMSVCWSNLSIWWCFSWCFQLFFFVYLLLFGQQSLRICPWVSYMQKEFSLLCNPSHSGADKPVT